MRFDRLPAIGSSLLVLALSGIAGAQSCFEPHADPGCDDADCEAAVCAEDFFCCDTTWDETCVELAKQFCDDDGGGGEGQLDCTNAVTVGLGDHTFNTSFDPASNIDLDGYCDLQSFGNSIIYNTVWFKWTCPKSEGYVFSTCDQVPFNTRIAIFEGACNLNNVVTCLDDTVGCSAFTTTIRYTAEAGVDYYICVGGQANFNYGTGVLSIDPAERVLARVVALPADLTSGGVDMLYEAWEPSVGSTDWDGCRADAESNGDQLASVSSLEQSQAIARALGVFGSGNQAFGLYQDFSASDFSEPAGGWAFTDGTPLTYTNWNPGEPNDTGGVEHVGQMGPAGQWNDLDGDTSDWNGYCVQRPGAPYRYTWPASEGGNDHEYEAFILPFDMTIADCHEYAEQRGGYLVSITTPFEMLMVIEELIPRTYGASAIAIGLYQDLKAADYVEPDGGWRWSSGEAFDFSNWNPGEPNDNPVGENYVEMFPTGKWNDMVAEGGKPAVIIEYEPSGPDCPADLTGDGAVDGADLTSLLGAWGNSGGAEDLDGNGQVDGGDLTILLGSWGTCL